MEDNFNKWTVSDLKNLLLQYDITDIKGSGKNGNVIKSDLIKTVKKVLKNEQSYIEIHTDISLPMDVMAEIINISDVETIINLCQTSSMMKNQCNEAFWHKIADREEMPIKTNAKDWIKEYRNNLKEVKVLMKMLKEMKIIVNMPEAYLYFNEWMNVIRYSNDKGNDKVYLINDVITNESNMIKILMELLYHYPNISPYSQFVSLRKHQLKCYLDNAELNNVPKTHMYKNGIKIWNKYYA
jgi:hypothetical protein